MLGNVCCRYNERSERLSDNLILFSFIELLVGLNKQRPIQGCLHPHDFVLPCAKGRACRAVTDHRQLLSIKL